MMKENAQTYVISKLSEIVNNISELKIHYKYDSLAGEHLIKFFPIDEYKKNEDLHKLEEEILFDFIDKYPYECLVFFTEDEWIDIDSPDKIFEGLNFKIKNDISELLGNFDVNFSDNKLFTFYDIKDDFFQLSEEILENYNRIKLDLIQPFIFENNILQDFYGLNTINRNCIFNENFETSRLQVEDKSIDQRHDCETGCGCNNYALAA